MSDFNPIGGYFELELDKHDHFLHDDGVLLNSGRNALEYILCSIPVIKCLYVPYFTCDNVLEPIEKLGIIIKRYHINEKLEIADDYFLKENEYLLYTNYYGVKDRYCEFLAPHYGDHLIIDNSQAFYTSPLDGIKTFYSPRKFVGIPDGGIAYIKASLTNDYFEQDVSWDRCSHLLKRYEMKPSEGYSDFKSNSRKLMHQPIRRMSNFTKSLLYSINFDKIRQKRLENFQLLHQAFYDINKLTLPSIDYISCPLVYPLWVGNGSVIKIKLIEHNIFCATYWPNVFNWCKKGSVEYDMADNVICIPIDQRYGKEEMDFIINHILDNRV